MVDTIVTSGEGVGWHVMVVIEEVTLRPRTLGDIDQEQCASRHALAAAVASLTPPRATVTTHKLSKCSTCGIPIVPGETCPVCYLAKRKQRNQVGKVLTVDDFVFGHRYRVPVKGKP